MDGNSSYSHTVTGLFWFDFPLAIVLCFIYHQVLRNPLFDNLPWLLNKRLVVYKDFQWRDYFSKNYIVVFISILIGASSHLFWDSFTHDDGFFVQRITILTDYLEIGRLYVPVYKAFKFVCSLGGGILILAVIFRLKKQPYIRNLSNPGYWLFVWGVSCTILVIRVYTGFRFYQEFNIVMTFIAACLIALVLASFVFRNNNENSRIE
jgi:hypothetical protein